MKAGEGRIGRVFILRLEDGDVLPGCIERFAQEKGIKAAQVVLIGGIGGGQVVVGPRDSAEMPPTPMPLPIDSAHEVVGIGILVPDKEGKANLHIHASLGRSRESLTGCLRLGASTWLVGEAVIYEILGTRAARLPDEASGFDLMDFM